MPVLPVTTTGSDEHPPILLQDLSDTMCEPGARTLARRKSPVRSRRLLPRVGALRWPGRVGLPRFAPARVTSGAHRRDPLWAVVLAGELRDGTALAGLRHRVLHPSLDFISIAAAEALAKIGRPAIPILQDLTRSTEPLVRMHAYGAAAWIADDAAYELLGTALESDHDLADVVANALLDHGRTDALPALWAAYRKCAPWQRVDFAEAIRDLHAGTHPPSRQHDWRLRYRRRAAWGTFDPGWLGIAVILRQDAHALRETEPPLYGSIEEILAVDVEPDPDPEKVCEECGVDIEHPTGIPVCPETALGAALLQHQLLGEVRSEGFEDLFDVIDDAETRSFALEDRIQRRTGRARKSPSSLSDRLAFLIQTGEWAIGQGAEHIGPARALLLAHAGALAERYGDPDGLLQRPQGLRLVKPKIGRNEPCPCGSGRKYKRCCG
jgi:hypothetical protein